ncbi:SasC/FmtB family protein [Staphylococcus aureus]|uniref:SasC/FmtB family protein n=1 Tax=Staphylococcus aureus TaxID=1280 RepID=UPI001105CCFE|nr:SasC/FmtB family protein [Staphylococcus aureus]TLW00814.1 DUF1542 domain-containing protein [Staphylococcus aureus]
MNLLKKNKYSIRKYKVGIFSTLIGTVLLLSNPNGAQALTTDNNVQSDTNQATPVNSQDTNVANNRGLANSAQNTPNQSATTNQSTNQALVNHNNGSIANQATPTSVQSSTPSAQNNNHTDGNTTATETVSNANNNDVVSNNTTLNVPNKTNENGSGGHLTLKEIQEDVRHSSDKPELVAIAEQASNRPKKRSRRAAPADPNATPADPAAAAANGTASAGNTATYTPTTDPNGNNVGQNAPNEVLSFDDNSIRPSTNRSVPSVTVVDNLPGFTLINGGKVGVLSHAMVRTNMFQAGSNRTYQAQGNVLALGRISGTDTSNHGDFNGIEKSLTVNPNSELIFEFNTMPTKNGQGATNVIIKNGATNDTIAEKTIEDGPTLRLFKVPDNVNSLKIQFVPKNDAITDANGIYQLKDGYKYYSFVDSIGLHSGSHVYVERRTMEPTATNNKEFTVTTSLKNNGNSGASFDTDEFVYKIQLPEGVEYVNNSLTKDFPSSNSGVDMNDFNVTYDAANRVITIKSTGGGTANSPARLMPDKILDLKYKLRVNNVPTPRKVTFNDTLTYKTYTQDFINSPAESHTVSTNPYTIDIIMNKDALQGEVDRRIQQADYTFASLDIFNALKRRAQTILDENRNNVPLDQRVSQADIDTLTNQMQHTLIRSVDAENAVNQKADQMQDLINQNDELTDEEKQVALNQLANNEKLALQNINQAVTNNDVKRVETNGIATLKGVQPRIVIKPEAQQAIKASAENQVELIKDTPHATVDELDEANQLISDTLKQAQQEIENTNQDAAVTDVRNQTIKAIEQIKPKVRRKRAALDSIEENNKNQLDAIRNTLDTTQDERDVAIDTLNKIVNTIKNDIAQNKTNAEVDRTETDGNDNIKVILPKVQVKPSARQSVGIKAEAQNALIDQSDLSTEEERLAAKHLVEQALNQAIDQINHADKTAQVNQDSINTQNIISKIKPATTVKATALQQIQNIATNKINLIKANNEATDEEQNAAIAQVEKELIKAKQQIASAVTNADVAYLLHDEKNEIREIEPVINRKASAREQLTTLFNDKKQAIEANIQATVEERNSILAQLQNIYDTAIGQIDQDRSNTQVDKTASLNLQTIHDLDVHPIKKPDAEKTINDDLARVTDLVQNYRKVSDRNKADALKAITALKLQMDEELKTARTNADVDAVLKRFNVALGDIEAVITEKENSLLRIDNIAQQTYAKFKAIATPEQLAKVKVLIDQYVADGNIMIDEDATLNDIKQHTQFIVDEILAIKLPAEATKVSPKVIQSAPKVCTPIKKEATHKPRKVDKELPNTGSEGMDLPLKEFALITGAALLARRRTKNEKES